MTYCPSNYQRGDENNPRSPFYDDQGYGAWADELEDSKILDHLYHKVQYDKSFRLSDIFQEDELDEILGEMFEEQLQDWASEGADRE